MDTGMRLSEFIGIVRLGPLLARGIPIQQFPTKPPAVPRSSMKRTEDPHTGEILYEQIPREPDKDDQRYYQNN